MSASAPPVCTGCLCPWRSSQYRTCDNCRARSRAHRRREHQGRLSRFDHSVDPLSLASRPPSSSTTSVCTSCLRPWISSQYRTCDICRSRQRGHALRHPVESELQSRPLESSSRGPTVPDGWVCTCCLRPWYSPRYRTCGGCRELNRTRYIQQGQENSHDDQVRSTAVPRPRDTTNSSWWHQLSELHVIPFQQDWSKSCVHCTASLLSKERVGWCCDHGKRKLPRLPAYPPDFQHWLETAPIAISAISRRLNNLFAFSAIGATEGFVHFDGLANVILTGRVYHRLLDLSEGEHRLAHGVPLDVIQRVRALLESVNPYISTIRRALDQVGSSTPVAVELQHLPAGGELPAIINTQNLSTIQPRMVVFFRSGDDAAHYVHILSRHYEPLQYPLLFPHGTPGWGYSSTFPFQLDVSH